MDVYEQIAEKLRGKPTNIWFVAKITAVENDSCSLDIEGLEITNVRLAAIIDDSKTKLQITPTVGSTVLVADLSSGNMTDLVITKFSEITSINLKTEKGTELEITDKIKINNTTVEISGDKITFNGGENGGVPVSPAVQENLNSLKSYCEALKSAISIGFTSVGAGTAANGPMGKTQFENAMASASISFSNIENKKITQ
jgi:uncharacterized protein YdaL